MPKLTQMETEARQAPSLIAEQLQENAPIIQALVKHLKLIKPQFVMTIARGSSDHAATFAKYLFETKLGLVTASAAPSVASIYHSQLQLKNALVIGISQSGKSEDICTIMQTSRQAGAITVALVNDTDSPLAKIAEYVLPLHAGPETAVAATKSYLTSLTALTQLVAYYAHDEILLSALEKLPTQLEQALESDWSLLNSTYATASNTFVIGRGYSFPIAQECALKFKETSGLQAEAFSSAEVLHGPFALIKPDYPVLLFAQSDPTLKGLLNVANRIHELGGDILLAAPKDLIPTELLNYSLNLPTSLHPICDPIVSVQAFYLAVAKLAKQRGYNPDAPKNLQKVTVTK